MNAQSISRFLAQSGHRPLPSGTPRSREGVRVTNRVSGAVGVMVDLDHASAAKRRTDEIQAILEAAGRTVERTHDFGLRVKA